MKGKVAFVLGAAVGYVLGTRAGRERYEQIKRGAERLWNTAPVQRGVGSVRGMVDDRLDDAKIFVRRASADAFASFARRAEARSDTPARSTAGSAPATPASTTTSTPASTLTPESTESPASSASSTSDKKGEPAS